MPSGRDDLAAAVTERPLALCRRLDLVVRPQWHGPERHWVVKDPLTLRYFYFTDEEHAVWEAVDGRRSLAQIQREFQARFAPAQLKLDRLQGFLAQLHRSGLIVAERAGQGEQLLERGRQRRRDELLQSLGNLLALRLRGIDPDRLLDWLAPSVNWLFSRWFFAIWCAIVFAALSVVGLQLGEIERRLPEFSAFFGGGNLLLLLATLLGVKTLHELGHALACKRFGGECHEIGIQFLVFTPCLYCNVSDAWLLPSKWQRIAISAAGIYVELLLAALATLVWRYSEPGLLNSLALNVMFVCSLGTLLFNGNPLLRYDGYYILSDLTETPNLELRSRAALGRLLASWCLGVEWHEAAHLRDDRRRWLALYAAAAGVYRCLLLVTIYFYLRKILAPLGLGSLADGFFLIAIVGLTVPAINRLGRFFREAHMKRQLHPGRLLATCGVLGLLAVGIACVPLPYRVSAPLVLQPIGAKHVYVTVEGNLQQALRPGEQVRAGEPLATLVNYRLQRERAQLESERNQQQVQLKLLEMQRGTAADASQNLPAAQQALAELDERLAQLREHEARLVLKSPRAGIVIPPPEKQEPAGPAGKLPAWQGTPLEPDNVGSHLAAGTLLCLVGDPAQLEAVAVLPQSEVEFVRPSQRVRLALDQWPQEILGGTVKEIAKIEAEAQPGQLVAAEKLATRTDSAGRAQPLETSYQVRIALDAHRALLLPGAPGRCKIAARSQPLAQRLGRYLSRTFRFTAPE
jgi:putative peptide zinc metalloprotease protein